MRFLLRLWIALRLMSRYGHPMTWRKAMDVASELHP
jgi:hypothetical protein